MTSPLAATCSPRPKAAKTALLTRDKVGKHLADQLLLPMALAGGGAFRTAAMTPHTRTNIEVIRVFLDVDVRLAEDGQGVSTVEISG